MFQDYEVILRNADCEYNFKTERNKDDLIANLTSFSNILSKKGNVWGIYLKGISDIGENIYRLKGEVPEQNLIANDGTNSQIVLDIGRHIGIVASCDEPDRNLNALVYMNEKTRKFSVQEVTHKRANQLMNGIWKKQVNQENNKYDYRFSVIMAIYNEENNLHDSINSIIEQTIGFEDNIQLILCDDGSVDQSGKICDLYAEMYPQNIIVVHKKMGVASARKAGLEYAKGKYVNFCDADDMFSRNSFENVWNFFEINYNNIDVVTIPIYFFGVNNGPHWQNYKFNGANRCVDLWNEYTVSDMFVNCSFFKHQQAVENKFDSNLPVSEDAKYIM